MQRKRLTCEFMKTDASVSFKRGIRRAGEMPHAGSLAGESVNRLIPVVTTPKGDPPPWREASKERKNQQQQQQPSRSRDG